MQLTQRRRVERPRRDAAVAEPLQPPAHLGRCLVGERDREDLVGLELADRDLVRDPARDRRRLSRSRAGKDADRPAHGLDGAALFRVQPGEDAVDVHPSTLEGREDGVDPTYARRCNGFIQRARPGT